MSGDTPQAVTPPLQGARPERPSRRPQNAPPSLVWPGLRKGPLTAVKAPRGNGTASDQGALRPGERLRRGSRADGEHINVFATYIPFSDFILAAGFFRPAARRVIKPLV